MKNLYGFFKLNWGHRALDQSLTYPPLCNPKSFQSRAYNYFCPFQAPSLLVKSQMLSASVVLMRKQSQGHLRGRVCS